MRPKAPKATGFIAMAIVVLSAAGCSKSDLVGSSVGSLTVQARASGGTGRFAGYADPPANTIPLSVWTIGSIGFAPVGAPQDQVLAGQLLTVSKKAVTFALASSTPVLIDATTLSQNSFAIKSFTVVSLQLGPGTPVPESTACVDQVVNVPPQGNSQTLVTFNPPLVFQVPAGASKVTLDVNVPKLIDAYLASFTSCSDGVLSGYDENLFAQNVSTGVFSTVQSN